VGSGFHTGATAKLSGAGLADIVANPIAIGVQGRTMRPTFDLTGATTGARDLIVTNPDGTTATAASAFIVQQGGAPILRIQKVGTRPVSVFGAQPNVAYTIVVQNLGSVDANEILLNPWE